MPSFLWAGAGFGLLLLLHLHSAQSSWLKRTAQEPQRLFLCLLLSLGCMIALRSATLQNTLAAALCLASIGFAAMLAAQQNKATVATWMAWSWLWAGLINTTWALAQYFGWTTEPLLGMAFGYLRQRNNFATLCSLALIGLLYLWHERHIRAPLIALATALLLAGLAASTSRTSFLQCAVLLASVLYLHKQYRRQFLLIALGYVFLTAALPFLIGSPESMGTRLLGTTSGGHFQDSRRILWDNVLALIHQQPLLGVGWRELDLALHLADFGAATRFPGQVDNAHNLPLQFAAELGIPCAALWLTALLWLIIRNKPWQARAPEQLLGWGILLMIGIHSLLEYPLWYAPFQIATGFAAGLVFTRPPSQALFHLASQGKAPVILILQGLAGIGLIVFSAYAAFDYHRVHQLFIADAARSSVYRTKTLAQAEASWLFAAQVRYAKLSTTPLTKDNAQQMHRLAEQVLHFSPEPWVFQKLSDAADLAARD
ncbi:MAG: Wzy polymerase domain-containing protein [Cytophagales bacterium]|nr:Wzy polymerase domain-containing protein [Cytophagales bacterium]